MQIPQFWIDFFSVFGGLASMLLAIISIIVSSLFFIYGMRTEGRTKNALAEIKTQADTLQQISSSHLGKFIDHSHSTINRLIDNNLCNNSGIQNLEQIISNNEKQRRSNE